MYRALELVPYSLVHKAVSLDSAEAVEGVGHDVDGDVGAVGVSVGGRDGEGGRGEGGGELALDSLHDALVGRRGAHGARRGRRARGAPEARRGARGAREDGGAEGKGERGGEGEHFGGEGEGKAGVGRTGAGGRGLGAGGEGDWGSWWLEMDEGRGTEC